MTIRKLILSAATACLLAAFGYGSAHAQPPLLGIIQDFCEDVAQDSSDAQAELGEATADLPDCAEEFDDCQSGLFGNDPVSCLVHYGECNIGEGELL